MQVTVWLGLIPCLCCDSVCSHRIQRGLGHSLECHCHLVTAVRGLLGHRHQQRCLLHGAKVARVGGPHGLHLVDNEGARRALRVGGRGCRTQLCQVCFPCSPCCWCCCLRLLCQDCGFSLGHLHRRSLLVVAVGCARLPYSGCWPATSLAHLDACHGGGDSLCAWDGCSRVRPLQQHTQQHTMQGCHSLGS
jgi:hypothetical protein